MLPAAGPAAGTEASLSLSSLLTLSAPGLAELASSLGKAAGADLGFRITLCYCNAGRKEEWFDVQQ